MFEPRDMWTKLKEKGETIFSRAGWSTFRQEPSQGNHIEEKEKRLTGLSVQHVQAHTPRFMCSEASVSMLVQCLLEG
ncbi:hypothetical protein Fmac_001863 [Flemingia macrophylla]|uniref:Uncharacterized protein n=1 Tax=Flemingia macrophylla TaxID=520843 RepID=A0ABD1NI95_9FABA